MRVSVVARRRRHRIPTFIQREVRIVGAHSAFDRVVERLREEGGQRGEG
jgi:hypothetical protein